MFTNFSKPLACLYEVEDGYDESFIAFDYLDIISKIAQSKKREILKDAYRILVYGKKINLPPYIQKSQMIRKEVIYDNFILSNYERSLQ